MTTWTTNELDKIGAAEELDLASLRSDGTLRKPTTIWVVRVGDDLYVRAYKGRTGPWYRHAVVRHEGRILAAGLQRNVTFVEAGDDMALNDQIDAAFRKKYGHHAAEYFDPMVTAQARLATIRPMLVDPVKLIRRTAGWSMIAPTTSPAMRRAALVEQ